jgi:hypothetical protein
MEQLTITVTFGNEAMQSLADAGHMLEPVVKRWGEGENYRSDVLRDENGNTVGSWVVEMIEDRGDARRTDPETSHQRQGGRVDVDRLMEKIWNRWDDNHRFTTDDDIADMLSKPRNVAAKVRQRLEKDGLLYRSPWTTVNPRGQQVLKFRPTHR